MKHSKFYFVIIILCIAALAANYKTILRTFYPLKYQAQIQMYAEKYHLDPFLVAAVIKTESNFDEKARSHKNAYGLMQITSSTAEWAAKEMNLPGFTSNKLYDPEYNIHMGCWYLDNLSKEFKGNMEVVLAAYNGGRGNVQKWLKDASRSKDGENLHYIPFKETDKYVKRVKVNYRVYKLLYSK